MAKKKQIKFADYNEQNRLPAVQEVRQQQPDWHRHQYHAAVRSNEEAGRLQVPEPPQFKFPAVQQYPPGPPYLFVWGRPAQQYYLGPSSQLFVSGEHSQHRQQAMRLRVPEPRQSMSAVAQQHSPGSPSQVSRGGAPAQLHRPHMRRRLEEAGSLQNDEPPMFPGGVTANEFTLPIDQDSVLPSIEPEAGQFTAPNADAGSDSDANNPGHTVEQWAAVPIANWEQVEGQEYWDAMINNFNANAGAVAAIGAGEKQEQVRGVNAEGKEPVVESTNTDGATHLEDDSFFDMDTFDDEFIPGLENIPYLPDLIDEDLARSPSESNKRCSGYRDGCRCVECRESKGTTDRSFLSRVGFG
jgi:hypothetical protein